MISDSLQKDHLKKGDLLFQLRTGGELEWVISRIFAGYNGMALNHVALYTGNQELVEAVMPKVQKTTVDQFMKRAVKDGLGRPCILVARLSEPYLPLVSDAIQFAESQLHQPYNSDYCSGEKAWYCSELILESFRSANRGEPVFPQTPMGFRDLETDELLPFWVSFYEKLGQPIPEGKPGSHPALLSCSDKLEIIKIIGELPASLNRQFSTDQGVQLA